MWMPWWRLSAAWPCSLALPSRLNSDTVVTTARSPTVSSQAEGSNWPCGNTLARRRYNSTISATRPASNRAWLSFRFSFAEVSTCTRSTPGPDLLAGVGRGDIRATALQRVFGEGLGLRHFNEDMSARFAARVQRLALEAQALAVPVRQPPRHASKHALTGASTADEHGCLIRQ